MTVADEPFALLQQCQRGEPVALLASCGRGPSRLLTAPIAALTLPADSWHGAFALLDQFLSKHKDRICAGWLGYDLGLDVEAWPRSLQGDFGAPILHVAAYRTVREFAQAPVPIAPCVPAARSLVAHTTQSDYERRVAEVVERICAGDIFQANLTQPFTASWQGDPRQLFWRLCEQSPAPFAAYVEDGQGTAVLSSSPEEFLWRSADVVRTRPIKGTRPRSEDRTADAALLRELLTSEKDQAELLMIVDLLRNDLGKVATTGSVLVGTFPEHDTFAQVHHMHATVSARVPFALSNVDLLRATFPGGSITGCPKLAAMELIEELELVRRGVYTGAIGTFGPGQSLHLNIAIRTLVHRGNQLRGNAGGGVTALSDPRSEWEETLHKMAGLERALQCRVTAPREVRE